MRLVITALALALLGAPALANPKKQDAEAAYKTGQAQYMKADYIGAAHSFKTAYEADPDPVYLFNLGQAYRQQSNKCLEAGEAYRRYLREAKKAPNEAAVNKFIEEVDDCARKAGQTPIELPPEEPVETATPQDERPLDTTPVPSEPKDDGGSNKRLLAYVVGGLGVVAAGSGFYFMTRISAKEDEAKKVCQLDEMNNCSSWKDEYNKELEAIKDDAKRYEKLMVGSFIVGGAAIATGVVLFVMGGERAQESPVTFTPTRGGATATYSLSF